MEENTNTTPSAETAEKATFDQVLQDPDYRRAFDDRVRSAVGRRFRTVDAQRAEMRALAGDMARHLGIAPGEDGQVDLDALRAALAKERIATAPSAPGDDRPLADVTADDPVIPRSRAQTDDVGIRPSAEDPVHESFLRLMAEGEALARRYPGFDLAGELADPRFAALLTSLERAGAPEPVRLAYEAAHHDEITGAMVRYAVERTAAQVAEGIRSGALRPAENGGGAASDTRPDPGHLTAEQRKDIRQRVMRGERVTF